MLAGFRGMIWEEGEEDGGVPVCSHCWGDSIIKRKKQQWIDWL